MADQDNKDKKQDDRFLRTLLISVICVPLIFWLLYNAYQKKEESTNRVTACAQQCIAQDYAGYDFQWPIFSGPKCTCLGARQ